MFDSLKKKFSEWTKKLSKDKDEDLEEIDLTKKKKETKVKPKKEKKTKEKKKIKEEKQVEEIKVPASQDENLDSEEDKEILKEEFEEKKELVKISSSEALVGGRAGKEPEEEKEGFFKKLTSKINKVEISEEDFQTYADDLELMLLENNVALEVVDKIILDLKKKLVGKEILKKELETEIKDSLRDSIEEVLVQPFDLIQEIKEKKDPYVVLFCGINGTGKTTTIAKIANMLKDRNISCVLAAGDTFRAASIEQLKKHGDKLGVKVISQDYGADPAAVGFDAIQYAKKNHIKCVLIDTAGRMHTEKNLMAQIEKVSKVCKPDAKIFVGESITGNDSVDQIKAFNDAVKIDGIILSKADIDEKGGTALSVGYVTKKPILFLGTGQEYDQIEKFDKRKFTEKLGLS